MQFVGPSDTHRSLFPPFRSGAMVMKAGCWASQGVGLHVYRRLLCMDDPSEKYCDAGMFPFRIEQRVGVSERSLWLASTA